MRDISRATGIFLSALTSLALLAACSKHDQSDVSQDAKDAANSARAEAARISHDPEWKRAAADLKRLGHDVGKDLRKGAAETEGATNALVTDAQRGAHRAGERHDQVEQRKERDSSSSG